MAPTQENQTGFHAEFFNLGKEASDIRSLAEIDFDALPHHEAVVNDLSFQGEEPFWEGGPGNFFAARFTANIEIETAGTYTFMLTSDDGSQMSIGDRPVIDNDGLHSAIEQTVTLELQAGSHPIEVLYFEARGTQTLELEWSGPDTGFETVSLDAVSLPTDSDLLPEPEPAPAPEPAPEPVPTPAPTPEPEPEEPELPSTTPDNSPERVEALDYAAGETVSISGARTTTLQLDTVKSVASVEIIDGPEFGHATVNPDNTIAVVMTGSDYDGPLSLSYKTTYADGSTSTNTMNLSVEPTTQAAGWGMGDHYMLARDAEGNVMVETGDNHRKVYVSESEDALTLADIAAREGISVDDVDARWLMDHPEYGGSEDLVLATDVGMDLWYSLTSSKEAPSSHWLLFESGYEYSDLGKVIGRDAVGESELHPLHVTSWGDGPAPVLNNAISISQGMSENVVVSNLDILGGVGVKNGTNILMTDLNVEEKGMHIRDGIGVTLHDSSISYAKDQTEDGSGIAQGLLAVATDGILLEGNVFHHNGWEDGYNMDGTGGAPDMYSHNVYMQWNTNDVTYRDNISSQGSSFGAQFRGGAFAEDNLFLDNNIAVNFLGGNYKDFGHVGNFTFFSDNVITSGAYKDAPRIGGQGWGALNSSYQTTSIGNIVAHLSDPDDPNGLDGKVITRFATSQTEDSSYFYEDTKVLNWLASDPNRWKDEAMDRNLDDVDVEQAMQTTIQRYAAELTNGQTATIEGLMEYILNQYNTEFDDTIGASEIIDYFQAGFNEDLDNGTSVDAHRFMPNDLADGVRWDNRINWDSEELPSDGDEVDLGGNWVQYGTLTSRIDDLDLGDGGKLWVTSGLLEVGDKLETSGGDGTISIDGSGQFWANGYNGTGSLEVNVSGGRFANTGLVDGDVGILVGNNAQAILATDNAALVLSGESELRITGSDAKVGFDGDSDGHALLQMSDAATLSFVADATGFSTLGEFRSGYWDQAGSPVKSGISLDGILQIDLSSYSGGVGTFSLIEVDALQGMFDEIRFDGLDDGLQANAVIDFNADTLVLEITAGNGSPTVEILGDPAAQGDEETGLWNALTVGEGSFDTTLPLLVDETELTYIF